MVKRGIPASELKRLLAAQPDKEIVWNNGNIAAQRLIKRTQVKNLKLRHPWSRLIYGVSTRSKKKGIPFDLTQQWFEDRYTGRCELTGIEFCHETDSKKGPQPFGMSVDRVVPSKGYIQDNCRLVIWAVNAFRGSLQDDKLYMIAERLLANRQGAS